MKAETVKTSPERLVMAAILVATVLVFLPVYQFEFLAYDDGSYVSKNEYLKDGLTFDAVKACFTRTFTASWQPLAMISHALDVELFGMNAGLHHLVSLLVHLLNVALLYSLLRRLTGAPLRSAFVAGLFALHPLHVESVAWISSRKDLVSGCFTFVTMACYMRYVRRPGVRRYLAVSACLILALLGKPMAVTLPALLLLLDYWPLNRMPTFQEAAKRLLEKVPLFAIAGLHALATVLVVSAGGAVRSLEESPLIARLALVPATYVSYLAKTAWPRSLGPFYPNPYESPPLLEVAGASILLLAITVLVIVLRQRRPYAVVGWFWFLLSLIPVIGLLPIGDHLVADRYTYIAIIGLFIILVWAVGDLLERFPHMTRACTVGALTVLVLFTTMTTRQVLYWRNDVTLFLHSFSVSGPNFPNYLNLGVGYYRRGAVDEALYYYHQALGFRPTSAQAFTNVGAAYIAVGRHDVAKKYFELGLEFDRYNPLFRQNIEDVDKDIDDIEREIVIWERTSAEKPENVPAILKLGRLQSKVGHLESAHQSYTRAIALAPHSSEAHANLGEICIWRGSDSEAIGHLVRAIDLDPANLLARFNLADALERSGRLAEALAEFEHLLELEPNSKIVRIRLDALASSALETTRQ